MAAAGADTNDKDTTTEAISNFSFFIMNIPNVIDNVTDNVIDNVIDNVN
jgi:hypothetical protein